MNKEIFFRAAQGTGKKGPSTKESVQWTNNVAKDSAKDEHTNCTQKQNILILCMVLRGVDLGKRERKKGAETHLPQIASEAAGVGTWG